MFDQEIKETLEGTFRIGSLIPSPYTPDQLRMAIVASNLRALAKSFLLADEHPERIQLNLKQVCLGIFGTCDFLEEALPSLEEEVTHGT